MNALVLSGEGTSVTGTLTVTDNAGNTAQRTTPPVKIDKTSPAIAIQSIPAPNDAGWNNSNVTTSFIAVDVLSGIGSVTAPITTRTEGAGQIVIGSATDIAGNSGSALARLNIDKTAPEASNLRNDLAVLVRPQVLLGLQCRVRDGLKLREDTLRRLCAELRSRQTATLDDVLPSRRGEHAGDTCDRQRWFRDGDSRADRSAGAVAGPPRHHPAPPPCSPRLATSPG